MSSGQNTILVIDDAGLVRAYYRTILETAGFRVLEALNGLEALETLLMTTVDLLIVDINMPQMDGFSFLRVLRQKERASGHHTSASLSALNLRRPTFRRRAPQAPITTW